MKPLPRGEDFKFVDDIFGGSIPKNFIPAVEKGIQEARLKGFLAGYPMVDFQVELYDGQYHDVDSSEMSFKIAGSLAFKDAVPKCRPTPARADHEASRSRCPTSTPGAVMGDLSSRRGRPQGMEPRGRLQVIKAEVPLAEMLSYDAELTSMTGGAGLATTWRWTTTTRSRATSRRRSSPRRRPSAGEHQPRRSERGARDKGEVR